MGIVFDIFALGLLVFFYASLMVGIPIIYDKICLWIVAHTMSKHTQFMKDFNDILSGRGLQDE